MYKNVLQSIAGIDIYPVISFIIFFAFFLGLLLYVVLSDKKHFVAMSELPLQNENEPQLVNELLQ